MVPLLIFSVLFCRAGPADAAAYYVSASGLDSNAGTQASPFATLSRAVDTAVSNDTVYVMTDLHSTSLARVTDKHVTITSLNPAAPVTITRSIGFGTAADVARGTYNPAMIEVTQDTATSSLTLTHIMLDDASTHEGTQWEQAGASSLCPAGGPGTTCVQDAIVAAYGNDQLVTVTLGDGAVLANAAGMSALRGAGWVNLSMLDGSKITQTSTRIEGTSTEKSSARNAMYGIWAQSATVAIDEGAAITNLGTLDLVCAAPEGNADCPGAGTVLRGNLGYTAAILAEDATVTMGGTISDGGIFERSTFVVGQNSVVTLGATGMIENNAAWHGGGAWVTSNGELHIYGTIRDNASTDNGGGVYANGANAAVFMHDGALAAHNADGGGRGGGFDLQQGGSLTMHGGTISGNTTTGYGAGVAVGKWGGSFFHMHGGEITGNSAADYGDGVVTYGSDNVQLLGGLIHDNETRGQDMVIAASKSPNDASAGYPRPSVLVVNPGSAPPSGVYMAVGNALPAMKSLLTEPLWLSNDTNVVRSTLATMATTGGLNETTEEFWIQSQNNPGYESFIANTPSDIDTSLPVYALVQSVDSSGIAVGSPRLYAVKYLGANTALEVNFPVDSASGTAIVLVQPASKFGDLTITVPTSLNQVGAQTHYTVASNVQLKADSTLVSTLSAMHPNDNLTSPVLTITLDPSLTVTGLTAADIVSSLFAVDNVTISGNTATVNVHLKPGWSVPTAGDVILSIPATNGTGTYLAADFAAHKALPASASFSFSVGATPTTIPSNMALTRLVPLALGGGSIPVDTGLMNTRMGFPAGLVILTLLMAIGAGMHTTGSRRKQARR